MRTLKVSTGERSYPIRIGRALYARCPNGSGIGGSARSAR